MMRKDSPISADAICSELRKSEWVHACGRANTRLQAATSRLVKYLDRARRGDHATRGEVLAALREHSAALRECGDTSHFHGTALVSRTVTLTPEQWYCAEDLGRGNASLGIRCALDTVREHRNAG